VYEPDVLVAACENRVRMKRPLQRKLKYIRQVMTPRKKHYKRAEGMLSLAPLEAWLNIPALEVGTRLQSQGPCSREFAGGTLKPLRPRFRGYWRVNAP
jgi:hypothetical protein